MLTHSEHVAAVKDRRQQLAIIAAHIMAADIISGSESHRSDLAERAVTSAGYILDEVHKKNPLPERK